jgi:hypothetical protein
MLAAADPGMRDYEPMGVLLAIVAPPKCIARTYNLPVSTGCDLRHTPITLNGIRGSGRSERPGAVPDSLISQLDWGIAGMLIH